MLTLLAIELSDASLDSSSDEAITDELAAGFPLNTIGCPPHADKVSNNAPAITVTKGSLVIPISLTRNI